MKMMHFEGTLEEFEAVKHLFENAGPNGQQEPQKVSPLMAVRCVLTRLRIIEVQKKLYGVLASADEPITLPDLANQLGLARRQVAGMLGALGRRINHTPEIHQAGLRGNILAMIKMSKKSGEWHYELLPHTREALEAEGLI